MSKILDLQAYKINDTGNTNSDDLIAASWGNLVPRERDRLTLPVLPNPGLVRVRAGVLPTDDTATNSDGVLLVIEPAAYWGMQNKLIRLPKGALLSGRTNDVTGSDTECYTSYANDAAFCAALDAAGVFIGQGRNPTDQQPFLVCDLPQLSPLTGGGVGPANYVGGDLFVGCLVNSNTPYIDAGPVMDPQFALDVASLAAHAAKYHRYRLRFYRIDTKGAGDAPYLALFNDMQTALAAAGIDGLFMGTDTTDAVLASLEADIKSFFGIP